MLEFGELLMASGLVLLEEVKWISFQGCVVCSVCVVVRAMYVCVWLGDVGGLGG